MNVVGKLRLRCHVTLKVIDSFIVSSCSCRFSNLLFVGRDDGLFCSPSISTSFQPTKKFLPQCSSPLIKLTDSSPVAEKSDRPVSVTPLDRKYLFLEKTARSPLANVNTKSTTIHNYSPSSCQLLADALKIPIELVDALLESDTPYPYAKLVEDHPLKCLKRIDYLVNVGGISLPEIVEDMSLLLLPERAITKSAFLRLSDKRKRLHPFHTRAEFCAYLLGVPLESFYVAAAKNTSLLKCSPINIDKAVVLVRAGYPRDLLLRRFSMLPNITLEKLTKRVEIIKSKPGSHSLLTDSQLLKNDGTFVVHMLKIFDNWDLDRLPPEAAEHVEIFSSILGVSQRLVVEIAANSRAAAAAVFLGSGKIRQVTRLLSRVNVEGETLLRNSKLFLPNKILLQKAVQTVQKVYDTNQFESIHLAQTWSLVTSGRLLVRGPNFKRWGKKGVWNTTRECRATEDFLIEYGFLHSVIRECKGIALFEHENIEEVLREMQDVASSATIKQLNAFEQAKLLNLVYYYVEKRNYGPVMEDEASIEYEVSIEDEESEKFQESVES